MKLANKVDRGTAIAMAAISLGVLILSRQLTYWDGFAPSSGFAPIWVGAFGLVLAALLFFGRTAAGTEGRLDLPDRAGTTRVLLVLAGLWGFVAAVPLLGMVPTGLALMLFMLLAVLRRPWLPSVATALITTALVYGVFVLWLRVALPKGVLGF